MGDVIMDPVVVSLTPLGVFVFCVNQNICKHIQHIRNIYIVVYTYQWLSVIQNE
jgi:hypothetical protein